MRKSLKKGAIAWMANHSVAANILLLVLLVGGYFSLQNVQKEVFPDVNPDIVQVRVLYPGASPEEVEQGIILAVEEAVRGLDGVDEVTSVAREGMGMVSVELLEGESLEKLGQDVQSEVDRITTFPLDAEEPEVSILSRRRNVVSLTIHGEVPNRVLHGLGEQVRDQLLQDENITQVEVSGLPPLEIAVEIPQDTLREYGLTLDEVAARLGQASVELPGGGVKTQGGEILVRVMERRNYGREFARTPIITTADGTEVLLGDIATTIDGFEDSDDRARFNGEPAIVLDVFRIGDQSPLQVEEAALAKVEEIRPNLPPGVSITLLDSRADIYRQRATLLLKNGALGLALVFCTLGLFLELRLAFWVMMGIPASFLGSLIFLPPADVSINMISMFAYIIALGIVVDDAIVVGENIYYHHQQGHSFMEAAITGARELATPVVYSILTNIVTFMPLYFVPGMMGKIFKVIPVVVAIVFLISLVESLFVLPAHLGHHKERKRRGVSRWLHGAQQWFGRTFTRAVNAIYGPFLDRVLRWRYVLLAAALGVFVLALAFAGSGRMGFGLFPQVESDFARVDVELPYGSAVEKTEAVMGRIRAGARQVIEECGHPELVTGIEEQVGQGGGHAGFMEVHMADPEIRDEIMGVQEFAQRWREAVGPMAGVDTISFSSDFGGPGGGAALTVELSHRSIDTLEQASAELAEGLTAYPRCKDIDDGFQPGKRQIDFRVLPEGKSLGLTAHSVARQVRNAFYGAEAVRQQRGREEVRVRARLPEEERTSEQNILDLVLRTPSGVEVPLREVVEMKQGRAYTTIDRRDGRRVVQVRADVTPRDKALEVLNELKANELKALAAKYPGLTYSFEGRQADMRESMSSLMMNFVFALMAVYVLLAIPFRSYLQPLIVMTSIPFGIIGAFLGHMIMGYALSVISMFGIVALSGVVVNDALILIDSTNRRRKAPGVNAHDAVHGAALQRFRPVLLTTLTTFFGLAPMIFETSIQAQMLIPMALSLGFGIVFATGITLLIVPCLYMALDDLVRFFSTLGAFAKGDLEALVETEPPADQA